jgi:nitrogen regulatory protein PII 2
MNKINITKKALVEVGVCGLHAMKVMGRGKVSVDFSILDELGLKEEIGSILAEGLSQGTRLIPKRMLTILVRDEDVIKVVATIMEVNKEGNRGDGKIFVLPLLDAYRVRTGEWGEAAV